MIPLASHLPHPVRRVTDRKALTEADGASVRRNEKRGRMHAESIDDGLRVEVLIEAPPERVFALLVEPEQLTTWMGTALHGSLALHEGYRLDFFGDGRAVAAGAFTEIDPPQRVAFTWGWEGEFGAEVPPGSSTVTIELTTVAFGTVLTLTHTGLSDGAVAPHTEGWEQHLGRLAMAGAGLDPGPYGGGAG